MRYRRFYESGGTFFFTVVTYKRRKIFYKKAACDLLMESIEYVKDRHPFEIDAYCICPDHLHMIWTLPETDDDYPMRLRLLKGHFSHYWIDKENYNLPNSRDKKGERMIWQRRYWEHYIRDENDFNNHVEYIHFNPVKHGFVKSSSQWIYSSFMDYVEQGLYSKDWGVGKDMSFLEIFGSE